MKNNILQFIIIIIISTTLIQCKNNNPNTKAELLNKESLPADFIEFFDKFHSDSTFQLNHIAFPLEGAIRMPESKNDSMIPYKWRKDKWRMHHKFDNYENLFTRQFYIFDENTIIEKISGVDSIFQMQRRFSKLHNGWNLIYYSEN